MVVDLNARPVYVSLSLSLYVSARIGEGVRSTCDTPPTRGRLIGRFMFALGVFPGIYGTLSDHYGRKPMLMVSLGTCTSGVSSLPRLARFLHRC